MKEFMKRASERLEKRNLNAEDWKPDLLALEQTLTEFLKKKGYDEKAELKRSVNLFRDDTDTRLERAKRLYSEINEHKEKAVIHGVERASALIRDILNYYPIGFLKEFHLQKSGLYIEIPLDASNSGSFFDNKKETQRLLFEHQIKNLKDYGFHFSEECHRRYMFDNDMENQKLLVKLLESFGTKYIEFHENKSTILTVSGIVNPEVLFASEIPKIEMEADEEVEKKNKLMFMETTLNQMYGCLSTINNMPKMINTCGYLIEHSFNDICEILGIESELCQKVKGYHEKERLKNEEIRELETKIGEGVSAGELVHYGTEFLNKLGFRALKEIGFTISDESYISPYHVNLVYQTRSIDNMKYPFETYQFAGMIEDGETKETRKETIKYLEETFDLIEPFPKERYMAYTEKNMRLLTDWVYQNFRLTFDSFEVANKRGLLYIKSFSILLSQL